MTIASLFHAQQPLYAKNEQRIIAASLSLLNNKKAVISRSQCLYHCFSLQGIPEKERKLALQHKVMQWSPYKDYRTFIIWKNSRAQVWLWQDAQHYKNHHIITSETSHYPPAEQDGFRLINCVEGVEAQHWQSGMLHASHWWPKQPTINAWVNFQRASGEKPEAKIPEIKTFAIMPQPWLKGDSLEQQHSPQTETWLWRLAIIPTIIATSWLLTDISQLNQYINTTQQQITTLEETLEPELQAKTEAYSNSKQARALASYFSKTTQLEYIDQFLQALSTQKEVDIISWQFANNSLSVITQSKEMDPSWLVKKINKLNWVNSITTENTSRPNQIKLNIKLQSH